MKEFRILAPEQRASFAARLAAAKARIDAGDFVAFDRDAFQARLLQTYHAAKRARAADRLNARAP